MIDEAIKAPLESIGKYEATNKRTKVDNPVSKLKEKLNSLSNESEDKGRLETWLSEQVASGKLELLTDEATAFKKVFVSQDEPDIVLKAFDADSKEAWQREADQEKILREYITNHFLPETEYVEISASSTPDKQLFVVQEREEGVQLKTFVGKIIELLTTAIPIAEVEEYFKENPNKWSDLKRMALQKFIPSTMWAIATGEARILAGQMAKLEEHFKISDLDFFITPEGKIKIIDLELTKKEDFEPIEGGYLEGLDDFKAIFRV